MLVLRADPWMPDYGMGFEAPMDEAPASADPIVETDDWSEPLAPPAVPPEPVSFVDGVRRVDLRLIAEQNDARAPGLFGSYAVGCVTSDGRASFGDHLVKRAVVLGGGLRAERIEVPAGSDFLAFDPESQPGDDPDRPLWGLQQLMRKAEGTMAAKSAAGGDGVVIVDGPLTFFDPTKSPVVGVVKRFARMYLDPERDSLVGRLKEGQRTPLFGVGHEGQPVDRYSWYSRLVPGRPHWHAHAGVVRCEVAEGVGLEAAVSLADRVSAMLPSYAGRPSDPRAPQNLAPVGSLERWLRHRLGHPGIVRRALLGWLVGGGGRSGGS
ncbi:MAG: hypothetical protein WD276_02500 [Actinomycetota bacterium]